MNYDNYENILGELENIFFFTRKSCQRVPSFWKSASAGVSAIIKIWGAVRKCVRCNYRSAGVRAPHSKIPRNPTSAPALDPSAIETKLL